jgi:NADH:ubiquinone oxidoreductase subunit D
MLEMRQSNRIIAQCIEKLPVGPILTPDMPKYILPPKEDILTSMEAMVHHFVLVTKGPISAAAGEIYSAVEAPKGELGFFLVSDGTGNPYRMRIRAPSFVHASILPKLCEGGLLADVIANIGSVDIVLGECDR